MDRRELLGILGTGAAGLAALAGREAVAEQQDREHHAHDHHNKAHEECMKKCGECAKTCNEAAHHCLEQLKNEGIDRKAHARAAALTMDCQEFCVISAKLIARDSELMVYSCQACADACKDCIEACERVAQSEMMKRCADTCRECEKSCREMVRHMKGTNV